MLWVLRRTLSQCDGSVEHPKHVFKLMGKNLMTILRSIFFLNWTYVFERPGKCTYYSFVFVALRPKSTAMVIAGRSVHLTTLFPGQA